MRIFGTDPAKIHSNIDILTSHFLNRLGKITAIELLEAYARGACNEKEKLAVKSKAESEYVTEWLESRRDQQRLRAEITRAQLKDDLERCRIREGSERLVTSRIDAYHRQSIQENERMASEWFERRRAESRSYEAEILRLGDEIAKSRAALEEIQQEYNQRQEFIDTSLAEREAARKAQEYEAFKLKWILKIQAAYRGMQVRRKLGPYRPEDKKKKRPPKPKK
ncbi:uncharacterized protein LOC131663090 [Phymastichus coffea]|uniref:uncharacterized protein LOC131663090 n=1 Tax=Phymastichus coffea TaxID=108790 RepID=UPI00273AD1C3|nr:uncharacterized protein LOC131663090 [Phymastichus coffea]